MGRVKLLILDIDGVMTDGKKFYDREGKVGFKTFCDKDWTAIKRLRAIGIPVMCITGDPYNEPILKSRNLDVIVCRGKGFHSDKSQYLPEVCQKWSCKPEEIAFIGDDLFDIGLMKKVGFPFCVENSPRIVKENAKSIGVKGGEDVLMHLFDTLESMGLVDEVKYHEVISKVYELDLRETF